MPVDHFPLIVPPSAFDATVKFLIDSLGHLGFKEFWRPMPGVVGMGETDAYFWISSVSANGINEAALMKTLERTHIAFQAESMPAFVMYNESQGGMGADRAIQMRNRSGISMLRR